MEHDRSSAGHTLRELFARYEADHAEEWTPLVRRQQAGLHSRWAEEFGDVPLRCLTPERLQSWRDMLGLRHAHSTAQRYYKSLAAPLTAAVTQYQWLETHPLLSIRPPRGQVRPRYCLRGEEQGALLTTCQQSTNSALYPVVALALMTGARKTELLQLTWGQLALTQGLLSIPTPKSQAIRLLPLPSAVLTLFQRRCQQERPAGSTLVFPQSGGKTPVYIDTAFSAAALKASLAHITFQDLRYTMVREFLRSGGTLSQVQALLGYRHVPEFLLGESVESAPHSVLSQLEAVDAAWARGEAEPQSLACHLGGRHNGKGSAGAVRIRLREKEQEMEV